MSEERWSEPHIVATSSALTRRDHWDHVLARWGWRRGAHRVRPGLYALGAPTPDAPVFVTANYTLSFDALRSALVEMDAYLLVLDTKGINVWCAAGKGTFGTDELVRRIEATELGAVVRHRSLILPQLGAAGVSAHEVVRRSRFHVEYGPVRARDLPEYLKTHHATPEMRRVTFTLQERLAVIPVEIVHVLMPLLLAAALLFFVAGHWAAIGAIVAVLAGVVAFPILLPWLPSRDFSSKGFVLGAAVALPIGLAMLAGNGGWLAHLAAALSLGLALPPVTAYLALNYTGSTPVASRSGVKREIAHYIPIMAWMFGAGGVLAIALSLGQRIGH